MKMSMKIALSGHIEVKFRRFFFKKSPLWVPFCHDDIYDVTIEFPDSKNMGKDTKFMFLGWLGAKLWRKYPFLPEGSAAILKLSS